MLEKRSYFIASVCFEAKKLIAFFYQETRTIFPVCRKNGTLSRNIPFDLIDDKEEASNTKVIVVCPVCFQLFDMKEKYEIHKEAFHSDDDGKVRSCNYFMLKGRCYKFGCPYIP